MYNGITRHAYATYLIGLTARSLDLYGGLTIIPYLETVIIEFYLFVGFLYFSPSISLY